MYMYLFTCECVETMEEDASLNGWLLFRSSDESYRVLSDTCRLFTIDDRVGTPLAGGLGVLFWLSTTTYSVLSKARLYLHTYIYARLSNHIMSRSNIQPWPCR
jgi:hypothetical protein